MGEYQQVSAPIVRVELFEDRASVVRAMPLREAGRHRLRVGPLTPLVRTRGLGLEPTPGVVVEEVAIAREALTREEAEPDEVTALRARVEALEDLVRAATDGVRRARDASALAGATAEAAWAWSVRALLESDDPVGWAGSLRHLEAHRAEAERSEAAARRDLAPQAEDLAYWQGLLREAQHGIALHRAWLDLDVVVSSPGELIVRYTVPCGLWRPVHRAALRGSRVGWEVGAVVWNATGEAWEGVQLVCSTERPGERADPPDLEDDFITARARSKEVVVEARDESVEVARQGTRAASELPGVDDGGEVRTFTAPRPATVPSDGTPVSVALDTWEDDAEVSWLAHPERSAQVVRVSRQHNRGARPLLAGPVQLVRDGQATGRAKVGLVGAGEPFRLGWGSAEGVRLTRKLDHEVDTTRITGHQHHRFEVTLRLVHLGDEALEIQVRERVPVSELKEVEVGNLRASPPCEGPDEDGFCTWTITLAPGGREDLRLSYAVDAPARVSLPW